MEQGKEKRELTDVEGRVLPYSAVVGQADAKRALEVAYVAPQIGGVLLYGERGTGKSTVVRAFSLAMGKGLPVTLPINATEDRVVGGWNVAKALEGEPEWKHGLLYEAGHDGQGKIVYVDEVNLLDDHLVNILLDVTATGILVVQREGHDDPPIDLDFTLVGTMNPEEGGLRPQLLDRFGLMVEVRTEEENRSAILHRVLDFDRARGLGRAGEPAKFLEKMATENAERKRWLDTVRKKGLARVKLSESILDDCVHLATEIGTDGHRGERVLALAAQAYAAIEGDKKVERRHLRAVAAMALRHRQKGMAERSGAVWGPKQTQALDKVLGE